LQTLESFLSERWEALPLGSFEGIQFLFLGFKKPYSRYISRQQECVKAHPKELSEFFTVSVFKS